MYHESIATKFVGREAAGQSHYFEIRAIPFACQIEKDSAPYLEKERG